MYIPHSNNVYHQAVNQPIQDQMDLIQRSFGPPVAPASDAKVSVTVAKDDPQSMIILEILMDPNKLHVGVPRDRMLTLLNAQGMPKAREIYNSSPMNGDLLLGMVYAFVQGTKMLDDHAQGEFSANSQPDRFWHDEITHNPLTSVLRCTIDQTPAQYYRDQKLDASYRKWRNLVAYMTRAYLPAVASKNLLYAVADFIVSDLYK